MEKVDPCSREVSRMVEKVDPHSGEVVETYKSSYEAAQKNSISRQNVIFRCDGEYKKRSIAKDGYIYRWADERMKNRERITGREKKRKVEKLDASGKVVAVYSSIQEAAKTDHKSASVISRRCSNDYKKPVGRDGYGYRYLNEIDG